MRGKRYIQVRILQYINHAYSVSEGIYPIDPEASRSITKETIHDNRLCCSSQKFHVLFSMISLEQSSKLVRQLKHFS